MMMFYLFGWQQCWCHGFTLPCAIEFLSTRIWTLGDFQECFSLVLAAMVVCTVRNGSFKSNSPLSEELVPKACGDRS